MTADERVGYVTADERFGYVTADERVGYVTADERKRVNLILNFTSSSLENSIEYS